MINSQKNLIAGYTSGKPVLIDFYFKKGKFNCPVVIFAHGFKGFKDWGHFEMIARRFAEEGFLFIKFNFSHNGITRESLTEFADLDAFGKNNYSIELSDLDTVINFAISDETICKIGDVKKLYLIGHSRGGGIALLKASEDARIGKLVTWAAVSDFIARLNQFDIIEWKEKGVVYSPNSRTGQNMPLYYELFENTITQINRFNILQRAKSIAVPVLVIHGEKDEAVPLEEAESINKIVRNSQIYIIEGAGHTFGGKHPYLQKDLPLHTIKLLEKTMLFLKQDSQ